MSVLDICDDGRLQHIPSVWDHSSLDLPNLTCEKLSGTNMNVVASLVEGRASRYVF